MRISQRQQYHRASIKGTSYLPIMESISYFLDTGKVISTTRMRSTGTFYTYEVRAIKHTSSAILIQYLQTYPLFSAKYLDFSAWNRVHQLIRSKQYKTIEGSREIISLKATMNTLRTNFTWDHLDNFYTYPRSYFFVINFILTGPVPGR
jgi:hypothetical protein